MNNTEIILVTAFISGASRVTKVTSELDRDVEFKNVFTNNTQVVKRKTRNTTEYTLTPTECKIYRKVNVEVLEQTPNSLRKKFTRNNFFNVKEYHKYIEKIGGIKSLKLLNARELFEDTPGFTGRVEF